MLKSTFKCQIVAVCVLSFAACSTLFDGGNTAAAQSGSRTRATRNPGSATRTTLNGVALEGYCPVCIIELKKWVRGSAAHQVQYDGKTYYFPGEKQKEMFLADPAKYVPVLGGDCAVCLAKMGKRIAGNVRYAAFFEKRLFLFPGADQKKEFLAHPSAYANVDLALDGQCAVCRVEMGKEVSGKPEIVELYHGLRYRFPSEDQRRMFLADPEKYAVKSAAGKEGSGRR